MYIYKIDIIYIERAISIYWRRAWQPTPVFLPGEFHGKRSLVGYSPCGCKESYMTKWLSTYLSSSRYDRYNYVNILYR